MFTSITIKNFRCFTSLELAQLGRVNLISGKNNTGKTAVLEAIQIHNRPNDCAHALSVSKFRGIVESQTNSAEVGGWYFCRREGLSNGFEISSSDEATINRTLTAWLLDSETTRQRFPDVDRELRDRFRPDVAASPYPRLVLQYEETNQIPRHSFGTWANGLGMHGSVPELTGTNRAFSSVPCPLRLNKTCVSW